MAWTFTNQGGGQMIKNRNLDVQMFTAIGNTAYNPPAGGYRYARIMSIGGGGGGGGGHLGGSGGGGSGGAGGDFTILNIDMSYLEVSSFSPFAFPTVTVGDGGGGGGAGANGTSGDPSFVVSPYTLGDLCFATGGRLGVQGSGTVPVTGGTQVGNTSSAPWGQNFGGKGGLGNVVDPGGNGSNLPLGTSTGASTNINLFWKGASGGGGASGASSADLTGGNGGSCFDVIGGIGGTGSGVAGRNGNVKDTSWAWPGSGGGGGSASIGGTAGGGGNGGKYGGGGGGGGGSISGTAASGGTGAAGCVLIICW